MADTPPWRKNRLSWRAAIAAQQPKQQAAWPSGVTPVPPKVGPTAPQVKAPAACPVTAPCTPKATQVQKASAQVRPAFLATPVPKARPEQPHTQPVQPKARPVQPKTRPVLQPSARTPVPPPERARADPKALPPGMVRTVFVSCLLSCSGPPAPCLLAPCSGPSAPFYCLVAGAGFSL